MREGMFRNSSGCAIAALFHKDRTSENADRIKRAMRLMHDRSNGLGGGFVGYGIYPQYADAYALHLFFDDTLAKKQFEACLETTFQIIHQEDILTRKCDHITQAPMIWRYFVIGKHKEQEEQEAQQIVTLLFHVNQTINGAYLFSCGKNMGVFKGVGYPEDIADFYCLEQYQAYSWIAHGRYPTNTPGWWAGAHPFSMLDFALVHNGEISSYDTNRRYIEMFDYHCSLLTDTEVITYILDFLIRRKHCTFKECADILAAPFWAEIEQMDQEQKRYYTMLRRNLGSLLICGPFSIILGFEGGIAALNDRLKLRSLMIGEKGSSVLMASEESALRAMEQDVDTIFSLPGGEAYVARCEEDGYENCTL